MSIPDKIGSDTQIIIPAGIHHIPKPILISGSNIRIRGEEGAILRGAVPIPREDLRQEGPGLWSAPVPKAADALYVGGRKYTMARYPKADRPGEPFDGYATDCILPGKTKDWHDPAGGFVHAIHKHLWGGYSYRIEGKAPDGTLELSGGWQNNRQMGMHEEYRFAENIFEELTCPGEWYFDRKAMRVWLRPFPEDDLGQIEVSVSHGFFILDGCEDVTVEGITFERGSRTFMETKEPLLRSDWTIFRGGAMLIRGSKNCRIDRCRFLDIGSNGVFVDGDNEDIRITRSHFSHIGASGLCFVGRPDTVRSPLFEYNETQSFRALDLEKGPKSNNYPKNCSVEDSLIEYVGTVEKQATGVEVSMAYGITVKDCTVCHTSRAGINISEGTFGGHRIEGCDVFDTVRETGDHGSFNSWGRDRYWHVPDLPDTEAGKYALLDMLAPNVITRSRFRCDRGWDIDLDDGSSNYVITENLCLSGGIKLREGFFRTVRHNITVNDTLHFHAWYPRSGDIIEENILFRGYAPYAMPEQWGERIDRNILAVPGQQEPIPAKVLTEGSGKDAHSVCLDPLFDEDWIPTDPKIRGFESFPRVFGVRYEPLRRFASTPEWPSLAKSGSDTDSGRLEILSMSVKNIENEDEVSVYATAGRTGALVLAVEAGSEAEQLGLAPGDVIVGWGEAEIRSTADLTNRSFGAPVTVLRKQQKTVLA